MRSRTTDPRRLDVLAFAKENAQVEGAWPLSSFERLKPSLVGAEAEWGEAAWAAQGELRKPNSVQPQPWLHLTAEAVVPLECQRCLGMVRTLLKVDRHFHFVESETLAVELDAEEEDDVLALPRSLDLHELIDEELLLALPLVPRHEQCPDPLPLKSDLPDESNELEQPHPFAALEALKRGRSGPN